MEEKKILLVCTELHEAIKNVSEKSGIGISRITEVILTRYRNEWENQEKLYKLCSMSKEEK